MKTQSMVLVSAALMACSACTGPAVRPIPAGYMGKVLTPTGWESSTRSAGQVDLREEDRNGNYNVLVLLEATSTTVKEQFLEANADSARQDRTDHRVTTKDGAPLSVDVYIRAMLPDDESTRDRIFTLVTPMVDPQDPRVRRISIQNVYERFAQMKIRNNIRMIFASYGSYKDVAANYGSINDRISNMVIRTFAEDHVPLKLQDVQLSNVKQDASVFKAQNDLAAAEAQADAIAKIGEAIRRNPEYREYMKWQSLKEIAATGTQKGTNTLIVVDGSPGQWAQAAYARGK
jgi:regulator of protease activity HflC (stomatin/prohibitin superfamily)